MKKLMALAPAFADFAPGLNLFDWLAGIGGRCNPADSLPEKQESPKVPSGRGVRLGSLQSVGPICYRICNRFDNPAVHHADQWDIYRIPKLDFT